MYIYIYTYIYIRNFDAMFVLHLCECVCTYIVMYAYIVRQRTHSITREHILMKENTF